MNLTTLAMSLLGCLSAIFPSSNLSSPASAKGKGVVGCKKAAPITFDDFYGTSQGAPLTVPDGGNPYWGVLNNDYDPDGDLIFVVPTTITSTIDPTNSITISADGSFVYTPGAAFSGTDVFEYQVCDNGNPVTCSTSSIYFVVNNISCIEVQISLWLEGPFNGTSMDNFMNLSPGDPAYRGILPGQEKYTLSNNVPGAVVTSPFQPYDAPPWSYFGTEGQYDAPPWYYAPGSTDPAGDPDYAVYHPDVVDWVLVRFRTGTIDPATNNDMTTVEKTAAALLFKDGTIRFLEDCMLSPGTLSSTEVYIQVDHRNHMAVMTPEKIQITNNVLSWDFRSQNSYRSPTSFGQKIFFPGVWAAYAGDGDQVNDIVNYEMNGQDNLLWSASNGSFDVYVLGDFNLSSDVTGTDKLYWSANNGISNRVPK